MESLASALDELSTELEEHFAGEERAQGKGLADAVRASFEGTGMGICLATGTTMIAFLPPISAIIFLTFGWPDWTLAAFSITATAPSWVALIRRT
jgi:hypothetical protein